MQAAHPEEITLERVASELDTGDVVLFSRPCASLGSLSSMTLCAAAKLMHAPHNHFDHVAIVVRMEDGELRLLDANLSGIRDYPLEERLRRSKAERIAVRKLQAPRSAAMRREAPRLLRRVRGLAYNRKVTEYLSAATASAAAQRQLHREQQRDEHEHEHEHEHEQMKEQHEDAIDQPGARGAVESGSPGPAIKQPSAAARLLLMTQPFWQPLLPAATSPLLQMKTQEQPVARTQFDHKLAPSRLAGSSSDNRRLTHSFLRLLGDSDGVRSAESTIAAASRGIARRWSRRMEDDASDAAAAAKDGLRERHAANARAAATSDAEPPISETFFCSELVLLFLLRLGLLVPPPDTPVESLRLLPGDFSSTVSAFSLSSPLGLHSSSVHHLGGSTELSLFPGSYSDDILLVRPPPASSPATPATPAPEMLPATHALDSHTPRSPRTRSFTLLPRRPYLLPPAVANETATVSASGANTQLLLDLLFLPESNGSGHSDERRIILPLVPQLPAHFPVALFNQEVVPALVRSLPETLNGERGSWRVRGLVLSALTPQHITVQAGGATGAQASERMAPLLAECASSPASRSLVLALCDVDRAWEESGELGEAEAMARAASIAEEEEKQRVARWREARASLDNEAASLSPEHEAAALAPMLLLRRFGLHSPLLLRQLAEPTRGATPAQKPRHYGAPRPMTSPRLVVESVAERQAVSWPREHRDRDAVPVMSLLVAALLARRVLMRLR